MRSRWLFVALFTTVATVLAKTIREAFIPRWTQLYVAPRWIVPYSVAADSREGIFAVQGARLGGRAIGYGTIGEEACRNAGMYQSQGKQ
jgi:hypothetical protein